MVLVVVPFEPLAKEALGMGHRVEEARKRVGILQGLEMAFRVRVVVGSPRPGKAVPQAEELDQLDGRPGLHRTAPVIMDSQAASLAALEPDRFPDEVLRPPRILPLREHPADHIPAEDVDHDIEEVVLSLEGPLYPRDVPAPQLVGARGLKDRGASPGVACLQPSFPAFAKCREDVVESADARKIDAFVKQSRDDFPRGLVREPAGMEVFQDLGPFGGRNLVGRCRPRLLGACDLLFFFDPVEARAYNAHGLARFPHLAALDDENGRLVYKFSSPNCSPGIG